MNLESYTKLKSEYDAFAKTVADTLSTAIEAHPYRKQMRLQQIQHRAKDPDSLKKKLKNQGKLDITTLETDIKDLAGVRLIFYTNSDVNRFLNSGIIRENFEIDRDRTKIHYPSPDEKEPSSPFISYNYVLKFKEERTSLPEYSRLQELWCEVQIQTILNHAWSEMAHDIIYKKQELKGFGSRLFDGIKKRLDTIQSKYLLPAGYEFQKVLEDHERLLSGKDLLDRGALDILSECNNNNSRYDLLQRYLDYVLPNLDDRKSEYPDIQKKIITCVKEARITSPCSTETPFGSFPGRTAVDILEIAADIFQQILYVDIEGTFDTICELFVGAIFEKERKRLLELTKALSEYNLIIWKQAGPYIQAVLVNKIQNLDHALSNDLLRPVILEVLSEALKPEIHGTSATYESVTLQRAPVIPNEALIRLRRDILEILKKIYLLSEGEAQKKEIIKTFLEATNTPHVGNYPDELLCTILENSREIVEFFTEILANQSFEILQDLEHQFLWMWRRNQRCPEDFLKNPTVKTACTNLNSSIVSFRDKINRNRKFIIYKTLVGYQSVFPPAWENESFDIQAENVYRNEAIDNFVSEINEENSEEWFSIIQKCAQTESNDLATFPSFGSFLEKLAQSKPDIIFKYLEKLDNDLASFLPFILSGLSNSAEKNVIKDKIVEWISKSIFLEPIVRSFQFLKAFDYSLLEKIFSEGIARNDSNLVINILITAALRYEDFPHELLNNIFIRAICYLTKKRNVRWINGVWYKQQSKTLLSNLSSDQVDLVLDNLIHCPYVEPCTEQILAIIADQFPQKIFDFFGRRLKHKIDAGLTDNYDPIPLKFCYLEKQLAKIPQYIVTTLKGWFDEEDSLFQFHGGRLPSMVFPDFPDTLSQELFKISQSGDPVNIKFVLKILQNYKDKHSLYDICKEIIKALPTTDELLKEVEMVLQTTGIIYGEFGLVEVYKNIKDTIELWKKDPDEKVKEFAQKYFLKLERQINAEQRSVEESVELRKHQFHGEIN